MQLLPNPNAMAYSNSDSEHGGNSTADWLTENYSKWQCELREGVVAPTCSLGISFANTDIDWTLGIDLSNYNYFEVSIDYTGPAKLMRINFRNYSPLISNANDYNSAKFTQLNIRRKDFNSDLKINLNEFKLADWWVDQFDLPHKLAHVEFNRVTSFGLDFSQTAPIGEHQIEFKKLDFVGEYITQQQWYFTILLFWIITITTAVSYRLHTTRVNSKKDKKKLIEMAKYAEELKKESDTYKNLSKTDPLTGVLNRYGLQEILSEYNKTKQDSDSLIVIILDLDHFKAVNDTFGHEVGDEVLTIVSNLLKESSRSFDSVARWGGEEFVMIYPHTTVKAAMLIAEKIRLKIENLRFPMRNKLFVTASFGISCMTAVQSFEEAFKSADDALYKAKEEGRNCCVLAQGLNIE